MALRLDTGGAAVKSMKIQPDTIPEISLKDLDSEDLDSKTVHDCNDED
jgi:hypothetical protein